MTSLVPRVCASCLHKFPGMNNRCDAYPDTDIPLDFFAGDDHFAPRDDQDNAVVHQLDPRKGREFADYLLVYPARPGTAKWRDVVERMHEAGLPVPPTP